MLTSAESRTRGDDSAGLAYVFLVLLCTAVMLVVDGVFVGLIPARLYGISNPVLWISSFLDFASWPFVGPIAAILEWPVSLIPNWIGSCYALFAFPLWIAYVAILRAVVGRRAFGTLLPFLIVAIGFTTQNALLYRADSNRRAGNSERSQRYRAKVQYLESDILCERGMLNAIRLTGGPIDKQRLVDLGLIESQSPVTIAQGSDASARLSGVQESVQQRSRPSETRTKYSSAQFGYTIEYGPEWKSSPTDARVHGGPMGSADLFLCHSDGATNFWILASHHPFGYTTLSPETASAWEQATLEYPGSAKRASKDFTLAGARARRLAFSVRELGGERNFVSVLMYKAGIEYIIFGSSPAIPTGASSLDGKFNELLESFLLK